MKKNSFLEGMRDGLPIGLGYFAVAFSLGIVAQNAGLSAFQGFVASFFNVASAGEYALFTSIQQGASYASIALITLIVNARYLLMSCSLSQKFDPKTKFIHRFLVGFGVTDEIFGITVSRPGYIKPSYNYGAILVAVPLWSIGTSLGIVAGNLLPLRIVSALSVALYGMFIAIIIPPSRRSSVILVSVLVSFILSWLCTVIPGVKNLSGGTRTIILTVLISSAVALIKPVSDVTEMPPKNENQQDAENASQEENVSQSQYVSQAQYVSQSENLSHTSSVSHREEE